MRISDGLTPPGGWKYQEGEYWIYGDDAEDLIKTIAQHRQSNGRDVGEPWEDICRQVIERHPELALH